MECSECSEALSALRVSQSLSESLRASQSQSVFPDVKEMSASIFFSCGGTFRYGNGSKDKSRCVLWTVKNRVEKR